MKFLMQLRTVGWAAVEAAFLLIMLCLLLDIVIGTQADSFVAKVAKNTTAVLQSVPPRVVVGVAAVAMVYGFLETRLTR